MGHLPGAKKSNFLFRGAEGTRPQGGRACGILSIPAKEVSLGSPRVGTVHVQSPTPPTPPLQAFLADFSQQTTRFSHLLAMVCFQSPPRPLGCCINGVCGTCAYPLPDLPRETSRSDRSPKKVNNLDPMAPRPSANVVGGAFWDTRGYVPGPLL